MHLEEASHVSNLRQGQFSAVAFVEFGCGQLSQLVMRGDEIFIDANVFFGIRPLVQKKNCRKTFFSSYSS